KLEKALTLDGGLDIDVLSAVSELSRARLIRMWLTQHNIRMPSRDHLSKIWAEVAQAKQDANPVLNLAGTKIRRFSNKLYAIAESEDLSGWEKTLEVDESIELPDSLGCLTVQSSESGSLSLQALVEGELRVTFNPEGLSARPTDRVHSRKLKKLF
ncbi:tRNA(Ile)-lysidine synthetase, partial [Vibrio xuii]